MDANQDRDVQAAFDGHVKETGRRGKYSKVIRDLDERISALIKCAEQALSERDAEIEKLRATQDQLTERVRRHQQQISELMTENAELRAALKPFAAIDIRGWRFDPVIVGLAWEGGGTVNINRADFEAARAAVEQKANSK